MYRFSRQSRCILRPSRLEPGPSAVTSGCSNTVCWFASHWPLPSQPRLEEATLPTGEVVANSFDAIFAPRRALPVWSVLFSALAPRSSSRWLIPSMIPGASQLFKTLLSQGDNPVKAVKDHVLRGRVRETTGLHSDVLEMELWEMEIKIKKYLTKYLFYTEGRTKWTWGQVNNLEDKK